jgi:predicted esterase
MRSGIPAKFAVLLFCALLLCSGHDYIAYSQAIEFAPGKIVENVICQADATQSYALYLPSNYSPNKSWPILYGFDPGGRGRLPVELFSEAAEQFGWIVVGSHNSRNGPGIPLSNILNALWRDTHERLAIDERRVYVTGMSGGARVAGMLAISLKDQVAGLIACGAGFPTERTPNKEMRFAVFGIGGLEDFNLIELHQLDAALSKAGLTHQILIHDGAHTWPPKAALAEAVEWMEVQALKNGLRPKDEKFTADLYGQGFNRARQFEETSKSYDAFVRYEMLASSFNGLLDVAEAATRAQRLKSTKEVQASLNQWKQADRLQEQRMREFMAVLQAMNTEEERTLALGTAKRLAGRLRKQAAETQQTTDRIVARRLLGQFSVSASEQANEALFRKDYGRAAAYLTVAAEIRPENPQIWLRLAAAQAQGGSKRPALDALKQAVAHGFTDAARLEQAAEYATLRQEMEFKALIEQLKAK